MTKEQEERVSIDGLANATIGGGNQARFRSTIHASSCLIG